MNVVMIGAGYVGLVSGACFADFGADVTCVDIDPGKIERLRRGEIPIYEPGLDELVARNAAAGRLNFTTDLPVAVQQADLKWINLVSVNETWSAFSLRPYQPGEPRRSFR